MTQNYDPRHAEPPARGPRWVAVAAGALALVLAGAGAGYVLFQPRTTPGAAPAPVSSLTPSAGGTQETQPATSAPPVSTPGTTVQLRESVRVPSVPNFRDVAGDGLVLSGGARMATGLVYRSGRLTTLSKADRNVLIKAGLSDIYDLRTPDVARRAPDPAITGATYHLVNLYALNRPPKADLSSVTTAREYMRGLNRAFVSEPAQRKRIAGVLREIAQARQPVLVHCSEGKDRTGWVSAMLQFIVGADEDVVLEQYLLSNKARADEIAESYASVKKASGLRAAEIDKATKMVDASYLNAGLTEVGKRYGSVETYLSKGLGLDADTLEALRTRLRVEPS